MSVSYPFIDIAALDNIREGFARGDAQLVLTRDLSTVLWINGSGAKLFGFERIQDIIGGQLELPAEQAPPALVQALERLAQEAMV